MKATRILIEETIHGMKIQRDRIVRSRINMEEQITKDKDAIKELDEGIEDLQKGLEVIKGGAK